MLESWDKKKLCKITVAFDFMPYSSVFYSIFLCIDSAIFFHDVSFYITFYLTCFIQGQFFAQITNLTLFFRSGTGIKANRAIEISQKYALRLNRFLRLNSHKYGSKQDGLKSIFVENYLLHQNYLGFISLGGLSPEKILNTQGIFAPKKLALSFFKINFEQNG